MTGAGEIPLTGAQHDIAAGDYRATITGLGAGLRSLSYRGRPVLDGFGADEVPPAGAGQLLAPWPNRVDGGRYSFAGQAHQLDLSEPGRGNAIHGLTRWASWARHSAGASHAELRYVLHGQPGYPFCVELTARYELAAGDGLTVTVTARNPGSRPAPYGTGHHPYLTAGTALVDECDLELPASRWLAADGRGIPSGGPADVAGTPFDFRARRPIGGTQLDHALTGLARDADGRARATLAGSGTQVTLWAGPGYDWLQVFTGDPLGADRRRKALAVEPMTCPPNALVSGEGLVTLAPGDSVTHSWGIEVTHL